MLVFEEERQLSRKPGTYQLLPKQLQFKLEVSTKAEKTQKTSETARSEKTGNPQKVEDYLDDIIEHLRLKESRELLPLGYLKAQPEIDAVIREVVVDWLVDVSVKFRLASETLFLAVNYFDRYLFAKYTEKSNAQLLGVTCLWIAAKYEEIYPPQFDNFVKVCDDAYEKSDLLEMEQQVLTAINFDLSVSTSLRFLQLYVKHAGLTSQGLMMARYICSLALTKHEFVELKPSTLAAGAVYLAGKIFRSNLEWPSELESATGLSLSEVRPPARDLLLCLKSATRSTLCNAVQRKFSSDKYMCVSLLHLDIKG